MGLVEDIIKDSLPIWDECIKTKFINELTNGALSDERMTKYIVEDTTYLTNYARFFAYQIVKCKTLEEIRFFYEILGFVNEGETSVRRVFLQERNIDEVWAETRTPSLENKKYLNHMEEYTKNGSLAEGLMALLPCMLSYEYIFRILKEKIDLPNNPYKDILINYMDEGYSEVCKKWIAYSNKLIKNANESEFIKYKEIFRQSSLYELDFWNMSYNI